MPLFEFAGASEYAAVVAIALANLAHRFFLLPSNRMSFDSWGHLYLTVAVKRGGGGPFKPIRPQVVGAEDFHYPLLPHWIYSHLPARFLIEKSHLINPLFEAVALVLALLLALAAQIPTTWVYVGGLGYIFTPLWFSKLAIGPRVLHFTTRTFSELLYPLALGVLLLPLPLPDAVVLIAGGVLLAAVLLGSKFGVQTVLLVTPLVALFAMSAAVAIALPLAVFFALLASGGGFVSQLRQQAAHLRQYVASLHAGKMPMQARNAPRHLIEWSPEKAFGKNVRRVLFNWVAHNSVTGVGLRAPHILATVILFAVAYDRGFQPDTALIAPVAGAFVIYCLTSVRGFLFLGEAERYLSHVSIWSNLLFVALCATLDLWPIIWLILAYGAIFSVFERLLLRGALNPELAQSEERVIAHLKTSDRPRTIIIYPYHVVPPYRIMIDTPHLCLFPWMSGATHKEAIKELEDYPYVDLDKLDELVACTGADTLVVDKEDRDARLPGWTRPSSWQVVEGDFGRLEIYERLD